MCRRQMLAAAIPGDSLGEEVLAPPESLRCYPPCAVGPGKPPRSGIMLYVLYISVRFKPVVPTEVFTYDAFNII